MSELKQQVLKLIREYVKSGRQLDEEYIMDLFYLIVRYRRLEEYFKIEDGIFRYGLKGLAGYCQIDKTLTINPNKLAVGIDEAEKVFESYGIPTEYVSFITTIELLIHESEHAMHMKELDSPDGSLRNRILAVAYALIRFESLTSEELSRLSPEELSQYRQKERTYDLYLEYHDFAPEERLAHLQSYGFVADIIRGLNCLDGGKQAHFEYRYRYWAMERLLENYEKLYDLNPTDCYFTLLDCDKLDLSLRRVRSFTLKERFELGVPITRRELKRLEGVKDCLEKRLSLYEKTR